MNNHAPPIAAAATPTAKETYIDSTDQIGLRAWLKTGALQTAILNSANFSSIATDEFGVIQIFNVGAEHMLGYSSEEVVNKVTPADISDPEGIVARANALSCELGTQISPGFEALIYKASRGIEDNYELTFICKDGSHLSVAVSVTALRDEQKAIIGYLLLGTDNTTRKELESDRRKIDQRLRDQQFYTRSLIESNIDALMTTDPYGILTDVNRQMEILTGSTREELIGTPLKNYFTDPERAEVGINLVLSNKKITNYELVVRARDGKETVVSYNATTFYDRDRKLQGVFVDARDITERKQTEQKIIEMAFHDSLTGLPNRRMINERLAQAMSTSKRGGRYGALIFLDLDNFKSLNDRSGHNVGDLLLIEVAHRISACVREVDVVARFGGDEFVVILSDLDEDKDKSIEESTTVAEKVRVALAEPYVLLSPSEDDAAQTIEHNCTSSIGVALFFDNDESTTEVIKWADIAMYKAKEAGGNTIRYYEE